MTRISLNHLLYSLVTDVNDNAQLFQLYIVRVGLKRLTAEMVRTGSIGYASWPKSSHNVYVHHNIPWYPINRHNYYELKLKFQKTILKSQDIMLSERSQAQ